MKKILPLFCFLLIANLSFSQTNVFPSTGRVGIGTVTPNDTSLLHIKGSHSTTSTLLQYPLDASSQLQGSAFLRTWASEPIISWNGTGIGANINNWGLVRMNKTLSSAYIRFIPQTTSGMMLFSTIDAVGTKYDNTMAIVNGNVGMGTTNPVGKFHVGDDTQAGVVIDNRATTINPKIPAQILWSESAAGGRSAGDLLLIPRSDISTSIRLFTATTAGSSPTEKMTVLGGGNVGIGTTTPNEKLDVNGNLQVSGTIKYGNAGVRTESRSNAGLQGNQGALSGFYETYTPKNFPKDDGSWWHLIDSRHSNNANNYAMQIAGSFFDQKLFFRKTNNDSTQSWKEIVAMDANGRINLDNDAAANKKPVTIGGYVYGGAIRFNSNSAVANSRNLELGNLDNNGTFYPSMVVSSETGNVGIGTKNPTGKFEISSSSSPAKFKIGDAAGNSINHLSWNTGAAIDVPDQGGSNPLIYFRRTDYNNLNNFTDVFQVKSDGSIQAFGQVRGSDIVSTGTNSWIFHTPDDGRKTMYIAPGLGTSDGSAGWDWSKGIFINNDGSMGIGLGIAQPNGYKLAIGGDMIAERVVVKLSGNWPDYVFKKNYGLRSLEQVEQFISQNSHLPEIPSAQEVIDKGIDVGQINAKLLQKVEELTLYLIEQNKEIKNQSQELTSLKKELLQLKDKK